MYQTRIDIGVSLLDLNVSTYDNASIFQHLAQRFKDGVSQLPLASVILSRLDL